MKLGKILTAAAAAAVLLVLSGCSFFDFIGIDSLMKPPKLTGENAELQSVFESTVGKDVILFSPIAGDFRSSYILFDYDGDESDEAVVFYAAESKPNVVRMHLMAHGENGWYSVSDTAGSGTDVYKIEFLDLDNNSDKEISVTWTLDDSGRDKTMSIYKIAKNEAGTTVNSLATIQLADYIYLDIDGDGINELLYFYYDSTGEKVIPSARLLEFKIEDFSLIPVSDVALNQQITAFNQIIYDKYGDDYRIYIDCLVGDSSICTELLVYRKNKGALEKPLTKDGKTVPFVTLRKNSLMCTDFDMDGYVDIPVVLTDKKVTVTDGNEAAYQHLFFNEWFMYTDREFVSGGKYFINCLDGYVMNFDSFYKDFSVEYDTKVKKAEITAEKDKERTVLFSVERLPEDYDTELTDEFNIYNDYLINITEAGAGRKLQVPDIGELLSDY